MRLAQGRLEQLMAYADGELPEHERGEVETLLSTNEDARQFLAELGHLGGLVRTTWEDGPQAKAVAAFDVTAAVMKVVEAEKASEHPVNAGGQVRSLDEARQKRAVNGAQERRGLRVGGVIVALVAAAAAIAVFARPPAETPVAQSAPVAPVAPVAQNGGAQNGGANGGQGVEPSGVEVEAVESPGRSVSVFHLPGASELSTSVVVWVEETGDKP